MTDEIRSHISMSDPIPHDDRVIQCRSIFAGPCTCGPAIHINLERVRGEVTATCTLSLADCEELIKQIRASMKAVRKSIN